MALHTFTTISISCHSLHSDSKGFAHATRDNGLSVMKRSYNAIYCDLVLQQTSIYVW